MTDYVVTHSLISCGLYPTGGGVLPTYYQQGDIISDSDIVPGNPGDGEEVIGEDYTDIWSWSVQSSAPPLSGQVSSDSGDWIGATVLNIATQTNGGVDASAQLVDRLAGSGIVLSLNSDSSSFAEYRTIADAVNNGSYASFTVAYLTGGGTLPGDSALISVALSNYPPGYDPSSYIQRMYDLGAIEEVTA